MSQGKLKDALRGTGIQSVILFALISAVVSAALVFADALRPPSWGLVVA